MHQRSAGSLIVAAGLTFAEALSGAQPSPDPTPILEPLPYLEDVVLSPSPCFEFACFDGAELDGDTLAVVGAVVSAVYVLVREPTDAWKPEQVIMNPDPQVEPGDRTFARPFALRGNDLVVSGSNGQTYVYHRDDSVWSLRQILPVRGISIALDYGTALIGTGSEVLVFDRTRSGDYRFAVALGPPDDSGDQFGAALAIDHEVIVVGAPVPEGGLGAAYVFERFRALASLVQKLVPQTDDSAGFASALDVEQGRIAIGMPYSPGSPDLPRGSVQIYRRHGWHWHPDQTILNPDTSGSGAFGTAIDLYGRKLVVGARALSPWESTRTHVYDLGGEGWHRIASLDAGNAREVRISGRTALVDTIGPRYGTFPILFDLGSIGPNP